MPVRGSSPLSGMPGISRTELMKERPILFSAPMVLALRAGTKTQSRRTRGLDKINADPDDWKLLGFVEGRDRCWFSNSKLSGTDGSIEIRCPYGLGGDRLWVREAWGIGGSERIVDPCLNYPADESQICIHKETAPINGTGFSAVRWRGPGGTVDSTALQAIRDGWRPSMFMPRWASRMTLEVISVRPERLNTITEDDARAEGVSCHLWTLSARLMESQRAGSCLIHERHTRCCGIQSTGLARGNNHRGCGPYHFGFFRERSEIPQTPRRTNCHRWPVRFADAFAG
jgi:hypothetical protein